MYVHQAAPQDVVVISFFAVDLETKPFPETFKLYGWAGYAGFCATSSRIPPPAHFVRRETAILIVRTTDTARASERGVFNLHGAKTAQ